MRANRKTKKDANAPMFRGQLSGTLKNLRKIMHMTQEEFAEKAGISVALLGSFEQARALPSYETTYMLCKNLNISTDVIYGLDTNITGIKDAVLKKFILSVTEKLIDEDEHVAAVIFKTMAGTRKEILTGQDRENEGSMKKK
jgi:transcriptional regulator with XRE-family HTH domain